MTPARSRRRGRLAGRLPRALHPVAWWIWAIGLAVAASRTTNPLLLGLIIAVAAFVVSERRSDAPWARGFRGYLVAGLVIVVLRVVYRILFGGDYGDHVLVTLPEIPLPDWAVGVTLGGVITLESVLAAAYDGLRLATLIICIGAANVLADPRRLLRSVPERPVRARARRSSWRSASRRNSPRASGESAGRDGCAAAPGAGSARSMGILMPVLEDALHRSLALAAAMDARGYGRSAHVPARTRRADRRPRHRRADRDLRRRVRRPRRDRRAAPRACRCCSPGRPPPSPASRWVADASIARPTGRIRGPVPRRWSRPRASPPPSSWSSPASSTRPR